MKPQLKKPATVKLTDVTVMFRLRRYCRDHDLLFVVRSKTPLGPVLLIDTARVKILQTHVPSLGVLAERLGLVRDWERI